MELDRRLPPLTACRSASIRVSSNFRNWNLEDREAKIAHATRICRIRSKKLFRWLPASQGVKASPEFRFPSDHRKLTSSATTSHLSFFLGDKPLLEMIGCHVQLESLNKRRKKQGASSHGSIDQSTPWTAVTRLLPLTLVT